MRIVRDFLVRAAADRWLLCENSWCGRCAEADLGIDDPVEYEEGGRVLLEGRCQACGTVVCTLLVEATPKP